jgi:hypothetical protein
VAFAAFADQFEVNELHARALKATGAERAALEAQLDKACAQKDCITSRLYWYTDFKEAQRAAQQTGKPILALYLLGRLDEELSCANSRFFRTLLYSDESIASLMRDDFVLYWHSVRPVPKITIEFGDGRKIQQTITGNSVHYLLSPDGTALDALPGLYSPAAFRERLQQWIDLNRRMAGRSDASEVLRSYHQEQLAASQALWNAISQRTGVRVSKLNNKLKDAMSVMPRAMSKMSVERPVLRQMEGTLRSVAQSDWERIGVMESKSVQFSPAAIELIRRKQFGAGDASLLPALLEALKASVASDSIFNECELHATIHAWFVSGEIFDLAYLNSRVYEELFLTPESDPWLGLKQPTIFTAISND